MGVMQNLTYQIQNIMKLILTALSFAVLIASPLNAQDYVFKVLANKGGNTVKVADHIMDWEPIRTGATLNSDDELRISENSYVGLVHASGKTVELKSEGNYYVRDLAAKLGNTKSSVASKYANFVINKMTTDENQDINKNHREYLTVTGAVERSVLDAPISLKMPSSVEVLNEEALIRWDAVKDAKGYVFTVRNMYDEVIFTKELAKPQILLALGKAPVATEELVIVNVRVKGNEEIYSGNYGIKRLTGVDADPILKELDQLSVSLKEETSLNKLILATFFEENNLLIDALMNYEKAVQLSPEVEQFKIAYELFTKRNGLQ
jgi:hypothetical protein